MEYGIKNGTNNKLEKIWQKNVVT